MLNLTVKIDHARAITPVTKRASLEDVLAHIDIRRNCGELTSSTAASYRAAIRVLADKLNRPLAVCQIDLENFDQRFPTDGFNPEWHKSDRAFQTWRRRTRTALKRYETLSSGDSHRNIDDDWTKLLDAIRPLTKGTPKKWIIAPQKLIPVGQFAKVCRTSGYQPRDVNLKFMAELETQYSGNRRSNYRNAAKLMDAWRAFPEALPFLPEKPINFTAKAYAAPLKFPDRFETEFSHWIRTATETGWDPVEQAFTKIHERHALVAKSAFRTFIRAAISTGALRPSAKSCLPAFLDEHAVRTTLKSLINGGKNQSEPSPRTLRKYVKIYIQFLRSVGHEPTALELALKSNLVLNSGAKSEKTIDLPPF